MALLEQRRACGLDARTDAVLADGRERRLRNAKLGAAAGVIARYEGANGIIRAIQRGRARAGVATGGADPGDIALRSLPLPVRRVVYEELRLAASRHSKQFQGRQS